MKLKWVLWLIAIAAVAGITLAGVSSLRGRMQAELTAVCGRPVTVRSAVLTLPPAVRLVGVELPAIRGEERLPLRVDSIEVRPGARPRERRFSLSGRLEDGQGKKLGGVNAQGTYLIGGPIDAEVALTYDDLGDLAPYLRKVLGSAPARGSMEMQTRLTVHEGVLMAHNDVTATGVAFAGNEPTTLGPAGNRLLELLRDKEGKVHLSFIVAGKLGGEMDWSDLSAGAMRDAMRQAMSRSIQQVLTDTEQNKPVEELLRRKLDSLDR